jgi:hypothetical protein
MPTLALLLLLAAASAEEPRPKPPELTVTKLTRAAPTIDGTLDDEAWKEAAAITQFRRKLGLESETPCRVLITYDDRNLYLAAECPESDEQMKKLQARTENHDGGKIWEDDEVEFFMDPTGGRGFPYYQIIVNWKGVTWDGVVRERMDSDVSWEPDCQLRVGVQKEGWTVELALPWTCFDRTETSAAEWNFNFVHVRTIGETLYWGPVFGETSHTPALFGRLKGMPVRALKLK